MKAGNENWIEAEVGTTVELGDTLKSGDDARAVITFFEGSTIELEAGTEVEVLELRRRALEDDRALAELRLTEATKWLEQGLTTQAELDETQWELDSLDHTGRILQLDALLLKNRLDALMAHDGDKQ